MLILETIAFHDKPKKNAILRRLPTVKARKVSLEVLIEDGHVLGILFLMLVYQPFRIGVDYYWWVHNEVRH